MWLAVDKDGEEWIYEERPIRAKNSWTFKDNTTYVEAPKGTIQRLLNYPLTWDDEAEEIVEYKNNDYQGTDAELLLNKMIDFKDEEYNKIEKKAFNLKKQLGKYVTKIGNQKEEITRLLNQKEELEYKLNGVTNLVELSIQNDDLWAKELKEKDAIIKYLENKLEI